MHTHLVHIMLLFCVFFGAIAQDINEYEVQAIYYENEVLVLDTTSAEAHEEASSQEPADSTAPKEESFEDIIAATPTDTPTTKEPIELYSEEAEYDEEAAVEKVINSEKYTNDPNEIVDLTVDTTPIKIDEEDSLGWGWDYD